MSHSISCDLSIARHEFKMDTICESFRPRNYRLASTSRNISVKIKVICFVELSKNRMWDKNRTSAWATVDRCTSIDFMSKSDGIQQNDTLRSRYLERYRWSKLNITFLLFRALLLGSNKKPETVFLNLVLERTSFPLIKIIIFRKFGF